MLDVSTAPAKELLAMAIKAEIEANKTYSEIASTLTNPLLQEKFQWLAKEENKHKEILEKLFGILNPGSKTGYRD